MVSDATNAPPIGPIAVQVGPLEVATGDGNWGCWAVPVNADATPDVILAGVNGSVKTVLMSPQGDLPSVAEYPLSLWAQPVVLDLDRDGDTDVAYLAGNGIETLLAQPGGGFIEGPSAAVNPSPWILAAGPGGRIFVATKDNDPTCNPTPGYVAILAFDAEFSTTTRALRGPRCIAPGRPGFIGVGGFASGDFDGDGVDDIAYGATGPGYVNTIYFRLSRDVPAYSVERSVVLPAPWLAQSFNNQQVNPWLAFRAGSNYSDLVVTVIDAPKGGVFDTGLAVLTGGPGGLTYKQTRLTVPGGYNLMSVSPIGMGFGGRPQLVAANVTNGTVEILDFVRTSAAPLVDAAVQLPERSFRVGSVCSADFDGDGIPDLFVAPRNGYGASGEILLGEGDGSYARRPRFAEQAGFNYAGDVDGDGLVDLLEPTAAGGLQVLFASGGELALGPETPIDGQFLSVQVADWNLDGIPDLVVRAGAEGVQFLRGLPARDGHFAPAVPVATVDPFGAPTTFAAAFIVGGHFQPPPAAPGAPRVLDLLAIERVGSVWREVALLFADATHAIVAHPPGTGYYAPLAFDADGDGVDDLADVFYSRTGIELSLVKPGDPLGASWPFRAWVHVSSNYPDISAGVVPVPGQSRARAVFVGGYGFTLVEAPGGIPGAIELPVDPVYLATVAAEYAYDAHVARVDGDPYPDLVLARPPPYDWLVFPGNAQGTFSTTPNLALSFQPGFATVTPLYTFLPVPGPTGQDDLVLAAGATSLVILHNDGAGHFH
jgi:hypothetical protein